jgi:tryptophan-rich sensory protein
MIIRLVLFLLINFGALAIGGMFTGKGVPSDWYMELNKAPWTPPGWMFGAAWTTIMICFSIYLAYLWPQVENKKILLGLFTIQWILNVSWNPIFFHYQNVLAALFVIAILTVIVGLIMFMYNPNLRLKTILILPYFIWLLIATSLNAYIFLKN